MTKERTMDPTGGACLIEDNAGYLHLCYMGEGPITLVYPAVNCTHDDHALASIIQYHEDIDWNEAEERPSAQVSNMGTVVWGEAQGWALHFAGSAARAVAREFGIDVET